MRTFQVFVIVMCLVGGLYLLPGPAFFWPDRLDPSQGVWLSGLSSRLLGVALLLISGLGVITARQAATSRGRSAPRQWQVGFFVLLVAVLGLISAAFHAGVRAPNPDWRPPSPAGAAKPPPQPT